MKRAIALWNFSRPHTVIGTVISTVTLYMIICEKDKMQHLLLLLMALIIGISCNIFIVGINQIGDVNIDKINKPYLPIPAGDLSMQEAKIIVYTTLLLSLSLALYVSAFLFFIILLSTAIGWAYSVPPLHLKRHHLSAAFAITFVRGVLINVGGFMVFNHIVNKSISLPENVKILSAFIIVFSVVISWFKDLPDIKGDSEYRIKTLAIVYSPKSTFIIGSMFIILTYLLTIFLKYLDFINSGTPSFQTTVLLYGHILLLGLFILNPFTVNLAQDRSIKKFYKRFWGFFFAEYMLYLIVYIWTNRIKSELEESFVSILQMKMEGKNTRNAQEIQNCNGGVGTCFSILDYDVEYRKIQSREKRNIGSIPMPDEMWRSKNLQWTRQMSQCGMELAEVQAKKEEKKKIISIKRAKDIIINNMKARFFFC